MTTALEPTDTLDAVTPVAVNGPEDDLFGWDQVDWDQAEREVRRCGSGSSRRRRKGT